jgi:hypothetical protein
MLTIYVATHPDQVMLTFISATGLGPTYEVRRGEQFSSIQHTYYVAQPDSVQGAGSIRKVPRYGRVMKIWQPNWKRDTSR